MIYKILRIYMLQQGLVFYMLSARTHSNIWLTDFFFFFSFLNVFVAENMQVTIIILTWNIIGKMNCQYRRAFFLTLFL